MFTEEEEVLINHIATCSKMLHGMKKQKIEDLACSFAMQKNKRIPES